MDWVLDFYNYRIVAQYLPEFARGIGSTAWISLLALVLSLVIGTVVAILRMSANPFAWRLAAGYVQAIRATPLLIQIYLIYFALPALPILLAVGAVVIVLYLMRRRKRLGRED